MTHDQPAPETFTVTDDPETWRVLIQAAEEAGADVEMADATVAVLRSFPPPPDRYPWEPGGARGLGVAVFAVQDLPSGVARLRHRPTIEDVQPPPQPNRCPYLSPTPNEWGCHDPECNDSGYDHECPVGPCTVPSHQ